MFKKGLTFKLLSLVISLSLIFSVCQLTASADIMDDEDYFGEKIYDSIPGFIETWWEDFSTNDLQVSLNVETFVFVDPSLLGYDFWDRILEYFEIEYEADNLVEIYQETKIRFLVHQSEYVFSDITYKAISGVDLTVDFGYSNNFASFCNDYVGEANMCALGIWPMDSYLHTFLYTLQNQWPDKNMPVYCIMVDPIPLGADGLIIKVFDSRHGCFITPEEAMSSGGAN